MQSDPKEENRKLVLEFLGTKAEKEDQFEKNMTNFFKKKRREEKKSDVVLFNCESMDEFEQKWNTYSQKIINKESNNQNLEEKMSIPVLLESFLLKNQNTLNASDLKSVFSAFSNFKNLNLQEKEINLKSIESIFLDELLFRINREKKNSKKNKKELAQIINSICCDLIKSNSRDIVLERLEQSGKQKPLKCWIVLEHHLCQQIQDELKEISPDSDSSKLEGLLKQYSRTLFSLLKNNLNFTFDSLSKCSKQNLPNKILNIEPASMHLLRVQEVLISLCQWVDCSESHDDLRIKANIQVFTGNLIHSLITFFKVHPFFAIQSGGHLTDQAGETYWTQILNTIDFNRKEELLIQNTKNLDRVKLMDHLLPGNVMVFHFLYSLTVPKWSPDRIYRLSFENNLKPLLELTQGLSEEYFLGLENWLTVFTDNSLSLEDVIAEISDLKAMSKATQKLLFSSLKSLDSEVQCDIIRWHAGKTLHQIASDQPIYDSVLKKLNPEDPYLSLMNSFEINSLKGFSEQGLHTINSFAKRCASAKKNSSFLRLTKEELQKLSEYFNQKYSMIGTQSIGSALMSICSFVSGNSDFFFSCFDNPLLMGRNPLVVKKQNYYFLLTLLQDKPDFLKATRIRTHFSPEISTCLPRDKLILDLIFASIENPSECYNLFKKEIMNPLYLEMLKQKMGVFYKAYLKGLQSNQALIEGDPIQENESRKNLFDRSLLEEDTQRNDYILETRLDEFGNPINNGNLLISGFDPKNTKIDDKFEGLGKLDLRSAAVVDFESRLGGKNNKTIKD